jgi:hypothetical protein
LIAVTFGLTGCFEGVVKKVSNNYDLPAPSTWAIADGKAVDIGGETVEVVGTDQ